MTASTKTFVPASAALGLAVGFALALVAAAPPILCLLAAVVVAAAAALGWHTLAVRNRASHLSTEMDRLDAVLAASPTAWCGWTADGHRTAAPGFAALLDNRPCDTPEEVAAAFLPPDADAVAGALERLRRKGEPFDLVAVSRGGRHLRLYGRRGSGSLTAGTVDALWIDDVTPARHEVEALQEAQTLDRASLDSLRAGLDALPIPVWIRDDGLSLSWCNRAYGRAVDAEPDTAAREQRELLSAGGGRRLAERARATGMAQSERVPVVIGTDRRLLEVTETLLPAAGGGGPVAVGYAIDRTELEDGRAELRRHQTAHAEVLERLGSAILIFGPDTRITFFNQAFVRLWDLDEEWLRGEPTHGELLEELRSRRKLPEYADFQSFKRERLTRYTRLMEAAEELMHLPDGTTLRVLTAPHPLGGLILILEDVTNTLALESSYNTLIAVQQETLDNLAEGIAVFGGDGRLKLSNPSFARVWDLRDEDLQGEPHITAVFERMRPFFVDDNGDDPGGWDVLKEEMIAATLDRAVRSGRLERSDGSVVEFSTLPLPDGAVLNSYLDVTDSARLEQALRASNAALEAADQLKSEFIANVSHHLRTPLNGIIGFAEVLANEYFGPLTPRQSEYVKGILGGGGRLLELIDDIVDLTSVGQSVSALERGSVDVSELVESVAGLTREWARREGLRLEVAVQPRIGTVTADGRRLKQALFNLVVAAIRQPPPQGRIRLSAERTDGILTLTVGDPTLPPADPARGSRVLSTDGLGLGMALVRSVVDLHGGRLLLDGEPGHGNRVRCVLPAGD
ncbi:sensor histidine kinase [Azospirillum oleiclasticum]|uniref:sensor histidine kinase n=1 Tax=Azospirillum oleiclasticum TaxID=2735135 RepID=UPI0031B6260E